MVVMTVLGLALARPHQAPEPSVRVITNQVNLPPASLLTWPPPAPYNNTVKPLGTFGSLAHCEAACLGYVNPDASPVSGWTRCQSFNYDSDTRRCVGIVSDYWEPRQSAGNSCGRVTYPPQPCSDDRDCSMNGKCGARPWSGSAGSAGSGLSTAQRLCHCSPGWRGDQCQTLDLRPAVRGAGVWATDDGRNTSTWGGTVVHHGGAYHMLLAEMANHCGIGSWGTNSFVSHAVSDSPGGIFRRTNTTIFPVFSHEPNMIRAPTGEFVVYFTANDPRSPEAPGCSCKDGSTGPHDCPTPPPARSRQARPGAAGVGWSSAPTWFSWSETGPLGPWHEPQLLFADQRKALDTDTNLAMVILPNGSAVGLARTSGDPQDIDIHLVTAHDWKDPTAYVGQWDRLVFENTSLVPRSGLEDPFLWIGDGGVLHAIFHNQIEKDDESLCGGHAYSTNHGTTWEFTGTAFSNTVAFTDGTRFTFTRRERPHLIFGDPLNPTRPTHLTSGVQYGNGQAQAGDNDDGTLTLLQPVGPVAVTVPDQ